MADKILVVEDDKKTASLIKLYLEREGFQTVIAYDGRQGLKLAEQHRPVFVILDLMLPVLDGWEVCRRLRQSSDVPILMLTARGDEVDRVSGLTLGAGELSQKDLPFIFERFYRGEKSRSREHGGAGIGLAIVKELIEAHDGHVGAEISGKETRIWFSIPV